MGQSPDTEERLFAIDRLALHLVDPSQEAPVCSHKEVNLSGFSEEQKKVVEKYFEKHLRKSWKAIEGTRTVAALFCENSNICKYYDEIKQDQNRFFASSKLIAKHFHAVVSKEKEKKPNILAGLLIILLVHQLKDNRQFMALYKVETTRKNNIAFQKQEDAGQILLGIVVQPVEEALPDPRDRVLKWAIMPHPSRSGFDLKVRDEVTKNIAEYFFTVLGCEPQKREKDQAIVLWETISQYVKQYHPASYTETTLNELLDLITQDPLLSAPAIAKKVKTAELLQGFQPEAFEKALTAADVKNLSVSTKTLRNLRLQYTLSSKIKIVGPRNAMENLVQEVKLGGGQTEIRIRTTSVQKQYV